jgi:hypothetical protein
MAARLTAEDLRYRAITEADWQRKVEELLTQYGWLFYHAPDNRPGRSGHVQNIRAGFPDLVAVRGSRIIYAELKRETGKQSPAQVIWQNRLEAAGAEYYLWKPSDVTGVAQILSPQWSA